MASLLELFRRLDEQSGEAIEPPKPLTMRPPQTHPITYNDVVQQTNTLIETMTPEEKKGAAKAMSKLANFLWDFVRERGGTLNQTSLVTTVDQIREAYVVSLYTPK
jgi:hypothetical protein